MYYIISIGIGFFLLSAAKPKKYGLDDVVFVAYDLQSESKSTHLGSNWAKLKFKRCTFFRVHYS